MKKVAIIMGSDSDLPIVEGAAKMLAELEITFEQHIYSAHRCPDITAKFAKEAIDNDFGVIIAAAGMAAHLAGAIAANTVLPVIGIPIKSGALAGVDALYATVMMPSGIPVATVAIDGAKNAAILAAQILAVNDKALQDKLIKMRLDAAEDLKQKDDKLNNN